MSTPPSSPSLDHTAIADLQTAHAASTTPALPIRDGAASALSFSASAKRHSTQDRDGTVSGASSPVKKRVDGRSSPHKRVSIDGNVPLRVRDDSAGVLTANSSFGQAFTPSLSTAIPSITPSPPTQDEVQDAPASPVVIPSVPPKRSKSKPSKIDLRNSKCLSSIRSDVFDTDRFINKKEVVYTTKEISEYDGEFQKQICFNFSATRHSQKKQFAEGRSSRSSATSSLDTIDDATSNYRDLSRYILEDLLRCQQGTSFLLCLPADSGDNIRLDLRNISKQQRQLGIGGDKIKLSGVFYYSF